jgi:hypothetical protein
VIFVAMGENYGRDIIQAILDVSKIRQDQINARLSLFRKQNSTINDQEFAAILQHSHIAANVSKTTKCNYAKRIVS